MAAVFERHELAGHLPDLFLGWDLPAGGRRRRGLIGRVRRLHDCAGPSACGRGCPQVASVGLEKMTRARRVGPKAWTVKACSWRPRGTWPRRQDAERSPGTGRLLRAGVRPRRGSHDHRAEHADCRRLSPDRGRRSGPRRPVGERSVRAAGRPRPPPSAWLSSTTSTPPSTPAVSSGAPGGTPSPR